MCKRYAVLFLLIAVAVTQPGCKKWLGVQPKDKYTEPQVFTNLSGASVVLNGMYLQLADRDLYGYNLTMSTLEIFAQRYNIAGSHMLTRFQGYQFQEDVVKNNLAAIWEAGYVVIVNANQFLHALDTYAAGKIPAEYDALMRGEVIGLRAMMHFDLLRMFGPVYNTRDSVARSIPYYRRVMTSIPELLPANQVMDSVLADLALAEQYLAKDPIIAEGVVKDVLGDGKDFFRNRNLRINYYAVKALQARVQLYRNNKPAALAAARAVVEQGGQWFPWIDPPRIISDRTNPDRVFSTELIMGLFNIDLYDINRSTFAPEVHERNILAPNDARLKAVFESNENDYRYNALWILPSVGGKSYRTFYKYTDIQEPDSLFRFKMPLIRLSEMYYILAECEPDATKAREYFNTVRKNRGLTNITPTANLTTELQKEYQKEFWGEGQLFYYYKRRNVINIPNSASTSGNVSMTGKYVLPLPPSETLYR